jgi:hypothetical protein
MNIDNEWVEISKQEFPGHVPRVGIDTLLQFSEANDFAHVFRPVERANCYPIAHGFWNRMKFVCRRKHLPTTTPAESAQAFPLIDRSKHSQDDIETALVYMIAEHLGMVTTRVTRADVDAAITEALADKAENQ